MTKTDLKKALEEARVSPYMYSLDGGLPNERYVLSYEGEGRWATYYSERGLKRSLQVFATEAEACDDLLEKVLHDSSSRTAKGSW